MSYSTAPGDYGCADSFDTYKRTWRILSIGLIGAPMSIIGLIVNLMLIRTWANCKSLRSLPLYFFLIAIFDLLLCITFFIREVGPVIAFTTRIYALSLGWHHVMVRFALPFFESSTQFASIFLFMVAIEMLIRLSGIRSLSCFARTTTRVIFVVLILIVGYLIRAPLFYCYDVGHEQGCPEFKDLSLTNRHGWCMFEFSDYWSHLELSHTVLLFWSLCFLEIVLIIMAFKKQPRSLSVRGVATVRESLGLEDLKTWTWPVVWLVGINVFFGASKFANWARVHFYGPYVPNSSTIWDLPIHFEYLSTLFESVSRFFVYLLSSSAVKDQILKANPFLRHFFKGASPQERKNLHQLEPRVRLLNES